MRRLLLFVSVLVYSIAMSSCGGKDDPEEIKIVFTNNAAEVTMSSAVLYGTVHTEYLSSKPELGFIISTEENASFEYGQKIVCSEIDVNGNFSNKVNWLSPATTYYYRSYLHFGSNRLYGEVKKLTTKQFQYEAIDLGLSVKWANANMGANSIDDYGEFYAWGETEAKTEYTQSNYKWRTNNSQYPYYYEKYYYYGNLSDHKTVLEAEDDVARTKLGGNWRIPTKREFEELVNTKVRNKYKWEMVAINGHEGYKITYLTNGNTIFLPFAGLQSNTDLIYRNTSFCYWSSELYVSDTYSYSDSMGAFSLKMGKDFNNGKLNGNFRYEGLSIRPVLE